MSRLSRFQIKTDLAASQLSVVAQQVLSGPKLSAIFLEYLIALHGIIRASEPLLQAGADEAARRWQEGDTTCRGLADYYALHKAEETDHALWLLEDIEALGLAREAVLARQPSADIAALVGSQYYWIYHYHPGFLLGYLQVLEGYPLDKKRIDYFQQQTGFSDAVFRTLLKHAQLDPGHGTELLQFLDTCALSDKVFDGLSTSSVLTCGYLVQVLQSLLHVLPSKDLGQVAHLVEPRLE